MPNDNLVYIHTVHMLYKTPYGFIASLLCVKGRPVGSMYQLAKVSSYAAPVYAIEGYDIK